MKGYNHRWHSRVFFWIPGGELPEFGKAEDFVHVERKGEPHVQVCLDWAMDTMMGS